MGGGADWQQRRRLAVPFHAVVPIAAVEGRLAVAVLRGSLPPGTQSQDTIQNNLGGKFSLSSG